MNIKAENLYLSYGNEAVLRNMNFEINDPKIYGLLGRNGVGKTSLLSLIGSFREPTSGKILINGEEPFENAKIMQEVTFMYVKDFSDESDSPVKALQGVNRYRPHFDLDYGMKLLKMFKLEGKKPLAKLSKGKQSAFNAVVGLASRSPITIFDEVYLGMDTAARDLFYKELLNDQQLHPRIIILSTHLVSEMDFLFDEIIIISQGKILLKELFDDVVSRGVTVTGSIDNVNAFTDKKEILNEEQLGDTRSVTLYQKLSKDELAEAKAMGLQIGPVSLHNLFIHLTKEDE